MVSHRGKNVILILRFGTEGGGGGSTKGVGRASGSSTGSRGTNANLRIRWSVGVRVGDVVGDSRVVPLGDMTSIAGTAAVAGEETETEEADPDPLELGGLVVWVSGVVVISVAAEADSILDTGREDVGSASVDEKVGFEEVGRGSGRDIVQGSFGRGGGEGCDWVLVSSRGRRRIGTASR